MALQEVVLDRLLARECERRGIRITEADLATERQALTDTLVRDAGASAADAERLLERIRRQRGLGDARFAALLRRNAQMRRLVAPEVSITTDEVAQAFRMLHGEKYRARVIIVPTHAQAARIRSELEGGAGPLTPRFIEAAVAHSTDASAARGGLINPISPADPAYPASVREALAATEPGRLTPVVAVDRGFAILLLEERIPADGTALATVAPQIEAQVRRRRERLLMDELARRLLAGARLTPLDRALEWSMNAAEGGSP